MAYKDFDGLSVGNDSHTQKILGGDGHTVELPDASYVRDAQMIHDGNDLVLNGPNGELVIRDYFADETPPSLVAPDGSTLTPELVQSFAQAPAEYAQNGTLNDASPVGAVQEVTGHATVTHPDGTTENIVKGTSIYEGDVVETDAHGAVNITFIDDTSFAVSEDARLAIDNYVYDPSTQSGANDFSVLKGVFVFTSGLIGRDDPDDVHIHTPAGSIGIRGTIIAGNVNSGEITVVEGAIVLTDHSGHQMTLATQFETARFHGAEGIENIGQLNASDVAQKFYVVSQVSPTLFSSINDAAAEQGQTDQSGDGSESGGDQAPAQDSAPASTDGGQESSAPATNEAATTAAALPPPPVSGAGLNPLSAPTGLEVKTAATAMSATTTSAATSLMQSSTQTISDISATTAGTTPLAPPPVNDPLPPSTTVTVTNHAPVHVAEAPGAFFRSAENQTWHYRFDKEFHDDGGHSALTYQLSANTIAQLNGWMNDGGGPNPDVLTAGGWVFDDVNGNLQLTFNPSFTTTPGTPSNLTIEIQAIDTQGAVSGYQSYAFSAYNANGATLPATYTTDGQVISTLTAAGTQISSDNSKFFLGDGNDALIVNNAGGGNTGSNNVFNLGDGINTVTVNIGALNNEITGGDGRDTVETNNAALKFFGMDGDDDIRLVLDAGSTVIAGLSTAGSNTVLDGGHSNFRAGLALNSLGIDSVAGEAGGRGDSLILQGAGSLDFGAINANNHIKSIERIDAVTSTAGQNITLSYDDILRITDDKNALIINLGNGDTLSLTDMGGMVKVANDISIDDAAQGQAPSMKNYDVFTNGHVTLLIHATGSAATGGVTFDGASTGI